MAVLAESSGEAPPLERAPTPEPSSDSPLPVSVPERTFAARVPPPAPARPLPSVRRAIFFDVENSSKAAHVARMLEHLAVDRSERVTDLIAVGNWRVVGHDTARLLAGRGAQLVHSAPSVGVRDWSDLRIAVAAGVWLAAARPGDAVEIVSDDQAFDAVGDVATSLGVGFRRLSYRALAGIAGEVPSEEPPAESRGRRRRRGGRRGRRAEMPAVHTPGPNGGELVAEPHTAPHDELLAVARELLASSPERSVSIDTLSNALKAHGFRRTPGSPRLITRLRRIKELEVSRAGTIRLVSPAAAEESSQPATMSAGGTEEVAQPALEMPGGTGPESAVGGAVSGAATAPAPGPRRRRRGRGQAVVAAT